MPTIILSFLSSALKRIRRGPLTSALVNRVWGHVCRISPGTFYFLKDSLYGNHCIQGGVCGVADEWLNGELSAFESGTTKAVAQVLLNGMASGSEKKRIFLDVGSNCGQWLLILKSLDRRASVHCFEPFPELARFLNALGRKNRFTDVYVNQSIVADEPGVGRLYFGKNASTTASTLKGLHPYFDSSVDICRTSIDDYVQRNHLPNVDLIKIDVELGELEVIRGATMTLNSFKPYIVLEVLYTENSEHLARQRELESRIKKHGYLIFGISSNGALTPMAQFQTDPTYALNNFMLVHGANVS